MTQTPQTFGVPTLESIWADVPDSRVLAGGKIGPHRIIIRQIKGKSVGEATNVAEVLQ